MICNTRYPTPRDVLSWGARFRAEVLLLLRAGSAGREFCFAAILYAVNDHLISQEDMTVNSDASHFIIVRVYTPSKVIYRQHFCQPDKHKKMSIFSHKRAKRKVLPGIEPGSPGVNMYPGDEITIRTGSDNRYTIKPFFGAKNLVSTNIPLWLLP
jgi:hypothetical protein